jgi:hypothetical protein
MHRTLHENKYLYKYVHALHHKYNKPSTLSPWASVAFNPIDGILQVRTDTHRKLVSSWQVGPTPGCRMPMWRPSAQ